MRKIKLIALMLCLVTCALLLSGCHGAKESTAFAIPDTFDASREYNIVFWQKNESNITQVEVYKKAAADFQQYYPNIHVTIRPFTNYADIYKDIITNIATGTTPNVCITYPDHIATYLTSDNCIVPLDELLTHEKYGLGGSEVRFDAPTKDEIVPQFLAEGLVGGIQYALPYMRSTEACYVNKTFVEKLDYTLPETLTWDFVWEVSEAAMAKDEDGNFLLNGQKVMIPFIYKSTDNMMIQMIRQLDSGYSTDKGDILLFNDTTKSLLMEIARHAKSRAFSTFKISSYPANFLNAGQCIFAVDSTAGATWMGSKAPLIDIAEEALVDFETVVMAVPQFDPAHPQMISQGPSMCIFNKEDPQEVLASWLFMQYLLTDEVQLAYSTTEGYIPVTSKAQNTAAYQDYLSRAGEDNQYYYDVKINAAKLLIENTQNTFVTPVFNGSASLRDAAGSLIEEVTKGTIRKKEINDEFIEKLYSNATSLYRLDQISVTSTGKADLGPLPATAVTLLTALAATWLMIILYVSVSAVKKAKKSK
ncbi:MAG: extracellular solute-binding protein [Clostridia bacterium]|nr:extracellular solute-binding protein [Clostridia bacterium]